MSQSHTTKSWFCDQCEKDIVSLPCPACGGWRAKHPDGGWARGMPDGELVGCMDTPKAESPSVQTTRRRVRLPWLLIEWGGDRSAHFEWFPIPYLAVAALVVVAIWRSWS